MQCQRSGFTLKRRDTGRQTRWGVEPHLHKIKAKQNKTSSKNCATEAHKQTRTDKQAITTDRKNITMPGDRHSQRVQKHYNIDKDEWQQIEEAPSQSPPRKVTHKHYGRTKVVGGILWLPATTTSSPRRASKGDGVFAGR